MLKIQGITVLDDSRNLLNVPNFESTSNTANSAYDTANSKTFIFYSNSAPSSSNSNDLWVNSDTGIVYENFGTNSLPIWAEFGPNGVSANTVPTDIRTSLITFSDNSTQNTASSPVAVTQASYNQANTATTISQAAYSQANTAYLQANTKFNTSGGNITGPVTISSTLTVTGNVTFSGNVTTVSANNLAIQDNMIYLNNGSYVTNPDLGISGNYNDGSYKHTGFFRDASDGIWKLFDNYTPEPDASPYIDTSNSSFRLANFQANTVYSNVLSTNTLSLNSGTTYGVVYLNGSNVATSGSALTFNGTYLTTKSLIIADGVNGYAQFGSSSSYNITGGVDNAGIRYNTDTGTDHQFRINNTERMRLNSSGNLGIGTPTPASILDATSSGADAVFSLTVSGVQRWQQKTEYSTGNWLLYNQTEAATRLTMSTSGNLGLGVTPSAWYSGYKVIETGSGSLVYPVNSTNTQLWNNLYVNTSGNITYKTTGIGGLYSIGGGGNAHVWYHAVSGTAGTTATLTQAMTLDANGKLGIGNTSPTTNLSIGSGAGSGGYGGGVYLNRGAGAYNFYEASDGTNTVICGLDNNVSNAKIGTVNSYPVGFYTGNARRMMLDTSGNLGLGATPSAWNSGVKALQILNSGLLSFGSDCNLMANAYYGSSGWQYMSTGVASGYQTSNGIHYWLTSISGSTGSVIPFTQAMTLDANGKLLVGTTSSVSGCQISIANGLAFTNGSGNLNLGNSIQWNGNYLVFMPYTASVPVIQLSGGNGYSPRFEMYSPNNTSRTICFDANSDSYINAPGNLAIGTTSASYRFHVQGATGQNATLAGFFSGTNTTRGITFGLTTNGAVNDAYVVYNATIATYGGHLWQQNGTMKMLLDGNGALNLGSTTFTKNPGLGDIAFDNGTTDTPGVMFYYGNNTNFGIDSATSKLRFVKNLNEVGGTEMATFSSDSTLTLNGILNVTGSTSLTLTFGFLNSAGGVGTSTGTNTYSTKMTYRCQAQEFNATSDERLKNIQGPIPLNTALNFVKTIDGVLYTWKPGFTEVTDEGLKSGFIAQRVHKAGFDHMIGHVPNELLDEHVDDDQWLHPDKVQLTMDYNQAVPYHHEVIKHLLNKIEELEKTINELKGI